VAFSIAQVLSGQSDAQVTSRSSWLRSALTLILANTFSDPSIAVAVCDALCGSIPIITAAIPCLPQLDDVSDQAGMSDFRCQRSDLFRATPGQTRQAGTSFPSQNHSSADGS
jgi:hypothetical protein